MEVLSPQGWIAFIFFSIVSVIFSLQEIKYSHLHPHLHFQFGSYLQLYP